MPDQPLVANSSTNQVSTDSNLLEAIRLLEWCLVVSRKQVRAVLALLRNPNARLQDIADIAGCARTSLNRMKDFMRLRAILETGDLPGGFRTEGGGLEAGYLPRERDD